MNAMGTMFYFIKVEMRHEMYWKPGNNNTSIRKPMGRAIIKHVADPVLQQIWDEQVNSINRYMRTIDMYIGEAQ